MASARRRLNSTSTSAKYRTKKTTVSFDNAKPRPSFGFACGAMPNNKSVSDTCYFKVQIPAEIFLAWFIVRSRTLFAQFIDQPFRQVITEAARIDEIVFWLGHVKRRALKRDDRSDFRVHRYSRRF